MKNNLKFKKILFFSFTLFALSFSFSFAQTTPEFIVSWQALNYVPAYFQGKIFPSNTTPVEVGFDLVDQNRIANLSRNEISWSVNGRTVRSGIGMKNLRLNANGVEQTVRITVFDYKGTDLDGVFTIPVTKPEVIIDAKTIGKTISLGDHAFSAFPFFFNIRDISELVFGWSVNGQAASNLSGSQNILNLNLSSQDVPQETELSINVLARKTNNDLEFGGKRLNLIVR